MDRAVVRELWSYPVKGCQGVAVESLEVTKLGAAGDRGFALWSDGELVDQKDTPKVASVAASLEGDLLRFQHADDDVSLVQVAPAERCIIITTDQKTGARPKSDLMRVLGQYRRKIEAERWGSGLIFGSYMTVGNPGTLHLGDRLSAS